MRNDEKTIIVDILFIKLIISKTRTEIMCPELYTRFVNFTCKGAVSKYSVKIFVEHNFPVSPASFSRYYLLEISHLYIKTLCMEFTSCAQ